SFSDYTCRASWITALDFLFSMPTAKMIVIGAGLAGLTAAVHLAERGVPVVLLEADRLHAGGRVWGGPDSPLPSSTLSEAQRSRRALDGRGAGGEGGVAITLNGLT